MINVNGSLIIQMINFLLLIWLLNVVLYRPIRDIIARRHEKVTGLEEGIEQFGQDLADKDTALKVGMREAREKGLAEKAVLEQEAREEEKKLIEQVNEKARADFAEIRERVAKETDEVRKSLQKKITVFADEISQKILGRAV